MARLRRCERDRSRSECCWFRGGRPATVWDPLLATHQGHADPPNNQKFASGPTSPWSYQARKYSAQSRHRGWTKPWRWLSASNADLPFPNLRPLLTGASGQEWSSRPKQITAGTPTKADLPVSLVQCSTHTKPHLPDPVRMAVIGCKSQSTQPISTALPKRPMANGTGETASAIVTRNPGRE